MRGRIGAHAKWAGGGDRVWQGRIGDGGGGGEGAFSGQTINQCAQHTYTTVQRHRSGSGSQRAAKNLESIIPERQSKCRLLCIQLRCRSS